MTSSTKRSLFGGAMFAAGLLAPAAHAQNFNLSFSYSYVAAFEAYSYNQFDFDVFAGGGFYNIGAYIDGAFSTSAASATSMNAAAGSFGGQLLGGSINFFSYFTIDQSANVAVNWDFSGDEGPNGAWIDSFLQIIDETAGVQVFFTDLNNPIGTQNIALDSSHNYSMNGQVVAWNGKGNSFYSVAVPTPGAAGLLGIAGLAAVRRRR